MDFGKFLQLLTLFVCLGMGVFCYKTYDEAKQMHDEAIQMHAEASAFLDKADSLMNSISAASTTKSVAKTTKKAASLWDQIVSDLEKDYNDSKRESAKAAAAQKIAVSISYRIEDRYADTWGLVKPDILGNEAGVVAIQVSVDHSGDVKKTSVLPATTITDENVIDSARKAALRTNFNYNYDAPDSQIGVITYTYAKK